MDAALVVLICVIGTALFFDFTNGFHDTGNAVAASIATGALKPRVAVALAAVMNLLGAFLSVAVALTVTNSVVNLQGKDGTPRADLMADHGQALMLIVLAGLVSAILWNMFTWLLGLPSSSSYALLGGIIGATLAALGGSGVKWVGDGTKIDGVVGKILVPALLSPVIAGVIAAFGSFVVLKLAAGLHKKRSDEGFRWGQIGAASLVSLAHGTNDAQKTMGVITLGLVAYGSLPAGTSSVPFWVKLVCALAIASGTYIGGWRIIRTLSKGLVEISRPQGMAADGASTAVILAASHLGVPLSTTQVASGSILGSGVGRRAYVRWSVAGRMVVAWATTLPAAGLLGAALWWLGDVIGGLAGPLAIMVLLILGSGWIFFRARHDRVGHHNVGEVWEGSPSVRRPKVKEA